MFFRWSFSLKFEHIASVHSANTWHLWCISDRPSKVFFSTTDDKVNLKRSEWHPNIFHFPEGHFFMMRREVVWWNSFFSVSKQWWERDFQLLCHQKALILRENLMVFFFFFIFCVSKYFGNLLRSKQNIKKRNSLVSSSSSNYTTKNTLILIVCNFSCSNLFCNMFMGRSTSPRGGAWEETFLHFKGLNH